MKNNHATPQFTETTALNWFFCASLKVVCANVVCPALGTEKPAMASTKLSTFVRDKFNGQLPNLSLM